MTLTGFLAFIASFAVLDAFPANWQEPCFLGGVALLCVGAAVMVLGAPFGRRISE